ncbi:MAG TPA: TIGR00159 family protein [Mogibacterium sp.]|nr:TIGR00159 family protein [Mogibacterium sp.]
MADKITGLLMTVKITDIIDIIIVAYLIYKLFDFIKKTRAHQLFRGVFLVIVIFFISQLLQLNLLNWLLRSLLTVGVIAVVILFQPEIRRALEHIGRRGVIPAQFRDVGNEELYKTVNTLVDAVEDFSNMKTGALMAIEGETMLTDIIETGVTIDAELSDRLLGNIFYEGSPLHDGALIIRGIRAYAASCVLPLTNRNSFGSNLGTRHRAALGLSEVSDAFVIVVSEETGAISVAQNGELKRYLDLKTLEKMLLDLYITTNKEEDIFSKLFKGGMKSGK